MRRGEIFSGIVISVGLAALAWAFFFNFDPPSRDYSGLDQVTIERAE